MRIAASHDLLCYLNSDIVLLPGFDEAVSIIRLWRRGRPFLAVGERWNLALEGGLEFEDGWADLLRRRVRASDARGENSLLRPIDTDSPARVFVFSV